MTPIRIDFELVTPIVLGAYPLHLDSLIAFAAVEQTRATFDRDDDDIDMREIIQSLPLGKAERDGEWCWKASALQFAPGVRSMRQWTRRMDEADYAARYKSGEVFGAGAPPADIRKAMDNAARKLAAPHALKIDTVRGVFKNHQQYFEVEGSRKATAWCMGNLDLIEGLMSLDAGYVTSLGKRGTRGYGKIASVTFTEDPLAETLWKQRFLPWEEEGRVPVQATVRPPYFDRTQTQIAWALP